MSPANHRHIINYPTEILLEVRKAVERAFFEATSRKIKEGNLAKQLRMPEEDKPGMIRSIINTATEKLGATYISNERISGIKTARDLYCELHLHYKASEILGRFSAEGNSRQKPHDNETLFDYAC